MATIKDVAELANVSITTVSRVLNNDRSLSVPQKTKDSVINAAKQLHYEKKKKKETQFVMGIIQWYSMQQEIDDPYYMEIRQGIENFCLQNGIKVIRIFKTDRNYKDILKNVNGLICIGKFNDREKTEFRRICQNILFMDMVSDDHLDSTMTLDFRQAVRDVIEYLISLDHKKIGYLGGREFLDKECEYRDPRKNIFIEICREKGILNEDYIKEEEYTSESGYLMMNEMISEGHMPTAVFCANDPIAIGAMRALKEHNYRIPEDISIVGFDDIKAASFTSPPLTTVYAPGTEMGEYGAHIVYSILSRYRRPMPIRIQVPCTLIRRESCQKNVQDR